MAGPWAASQDNLIFPLYIVILAKPLRAGGSILLRTLQGQKGIWGYSVPRCHQSLLRVQAGRRSADGGRWGMGSSRGCVPAELWAEWLGEGQLHQLRGAFLKACVALAFHEPGGALLSCYRPGDTRHPLIGQTRCLWNPLAASLLKLILEFLRHKIGQLVPWGDLPFFKVWT